MSGTLGGINHIPAFNTGDGNWNSALGNLAGALFPDPMRQAQGYYYGTEARNAIIKGDVATSEQNAAANALMMALAQSNPNMAPTMPTFHRSGVAGGPVIMDAPANTPGLATTVAGGAGASAGAPPPPPPQTVSPTQLYDATQPHDGNNAVLSGQPPPVSPPAPGAPPAPNTTGTDGSVPANDPNSGLLHPGSITQPGGGQKYAGPANADGSPARTPINLGTYVAMQAMAGRNADMAKVQGMAFLMQAFQQGLIDHNTFAQLSSGIGNNAMYESDQATGRTGMTVAGELAKQRMVEQQRESEFGRTTQANQITRDANGNPVINLPPLPGQTELRPVGTGFNEPLESQSREPFTVGGGGPTGTGPVVSTKGQAPGQPGYDAQLAQIQQKPVQVYQNGPDGRPDIEKPPRTMSYAQAQQQGLTLTPTSTEEINALVRGGSVYGTTGGAPARLADVVAGTTAATQPPATSKEAGDTLNLRDQIVQHAFPTPDPAVNPGSWKRTEPGILTPQAQAVYNDYADELRRKFPRLTPANVDTMAMQHLQNAGLIPTNEQVLKARTLSVNNYWGGNPAIEQQAARGGTQGRFAIPLMKDYTTATGEVIRANPNQAGAGNAGGAAAPTPQPTPQQGGAPIARAPAGAQAGARAQLPDGRTGVVHADGLVYAN